MTSPCPTVQPGSFLTLHYRLSGPAGDVVNTFAAAPAQAEARQLELAALAGDAALCLDLVPVVREKIEALVTAMKASLQ